MNDFELLARWVDDLRRDLHQLLDGLTAEDLAFRPDAEAHGIGVVAWHIGRWLDVLATQVVAGRGALEERWHRDGWASRTGYDPRGKGAGGWGTLTGYDAAQVTEIPRLGAVDLDAYLGAVATDLQGGIRGLAPGSLAPESPPYTRLAPVLQGCWGHRGEIETLRSLALRARR